MLVKYTYYGDANLDGVVDGSDYSRIDVGFLSNGSMTGWYNGDFNYDGVINGSDYTLIDNAFNTQGAALTASLASPLASITTELAPSTSVPEPTMLGLLALAAPRMLGRRKKEMKLPSFVSKRIVQSKPVSEVLRRAGFSDRPIRLFGIPQRPA